MGFYMQYMSKWPEYFTTAEAPGGTMMGYIMGKAEGAGLKWHGHVTAVTVAPEFRRMGLANQLMDSLEQISDILYDNITFFLQWQFIPVKTSLIFTCADFYLQS